MNFHKYTYYLASIGKLLTGIQPWPKVLQSFLFPSKDLHLTIRLRQTGVTMKTRGAMDIWTVKETFLDRFYDRKLGIAIQDGWNIIDIGAGIGDFTILAAAQHPRCRVAGFEPTRGSFELCQENLRLNQIGNAQVFPEAIWSQNGAMALNTDFSEPGQFTTQAIAAPPANPAWLVQSIGLESAFERLHFEQVDLIKIDCEGAEYEILFKTPGDILKRIQRVVLEYHENATAYRAADLVKFFEENGYQVKVLPNAVHAHLGYMAATRTD